MSVLLALTWELLANIFNKMMSAVVFIKLPSEIVVGPYEFSPPLSSPYYLVTLNHAPPYSSLSLK
jgi:hypothetical protein